MTPELLQALKDLGFVRIDGLSSIRLEPQYNGCWDCSNAWGGILIAIVSSGGEIWVGARPGESGMGQLNMLYSSLCPEGNAGILRLLKDFKEPSFADILKRLADPNYSA